ncbi:hypothetical protein pEaSNUABM25_00315 [Erwinia phage pEa_SNUABM_25]|nr:hypothetical protein pEaSNUABM25_00315 [Erwinia phage pEa_SNUABM_25]
MKPIKATEADKALQNECMDAVAQCIILNTPDWRDVAIAGLRLYLVASSMSGAELPCMQFEHNGKPCRLSFKMNVVDEGEDFTPNEVNQAHQQEMVECILAKTEALGGYSYFDLFICAGRLFMIGFDGMADTVPALMFRSDKKNYRVNLING